LAVIDRIRHNPHSAPRVRQRAEVRCRRSLPIRVFYRVRDDAIEILHIRHTARRPMEIIDLTVK
jgi:hypothetical protein